MGPIDLSLVIRDSMKLQHGYCFPDFANSNSFLRERNGCFKNMRISNKKNKLDIKNSFFNNLARQNILMGSLENID